MVVCSGVSISILHNTRRDVFVKRRTLSAPNEFYKTLNRLGSPLTEPTDMPFRRWTLVFFGVMQPEIGRKRSSRSRKKPAGTEHAPRFRRTSSLTETESHLPRIFPPSHTDARTTPHCCRGYASSAHITHCACMNLSWPMLGSVGGDRRTLMPGGVSYMAAVILVLCDERPILFRS